MNKQIAKITGNPVGAAIGGIGTFYAVKKFTPVKNIFAVVALSLVGAFAGASIQSSMSAKASQPDKNTVKK